MKVWRIKYKDGKEITKLCDINEISPRLYTVAHKVRCNNCSKDATHLAEGDSFCFMGIGEIKQQIPLCEEHNKQFMETK